MSSAVYEWHASRAARCLDSLLGPGFTGKLQCDGYSAYPAFAKDKATVALFGCWAHARRNFFEAQEEAPRVAGWILNQIGLLYRWEEELRRNRAGPVLRQVQRSSHHRMVIERLSRALKKLRPRYLPQSLMGQAIGYAVNQWPMLEGFLEHGEVEIDNNLVENVTQSFGLRSLFRDAHNAENQSQRPPASKLYLVSKAASLGITAACNYSSAAVFMMGMPFVQRIHPVSDLCCASVMPRVLRGD